MKLPSKEIHIKTIEELEKKRFQLFDYIIYISEKEFKKMSTELNMAIVYQMNEFRMEEDYNNE